MPELQIEQRIDFIGELAGAVQAIFELADLGELRAQATLEQAFPAVHGALDLAREIRDELVLILPELLQILVTGLRVLGLSADHLGLNGGELFDQRLGAVGLRHELRLLRDESLERTSESIDEVKTKLEELGLGLREE